MTRCKHGQEVSESSSAFSHGSVFSRSIWRFSARTVTAKPLPVGHSSHSHRGTASGQPAAADDHARSSQVTPPAHPGSHIGRHAWCWAQRDDRTRRALALDLAIATVSTKAGHDVMFADSA